MRWWRAGSLAVVLAGVFAAGRLTAPEPEPRVVQAIAETRPWSEGLSLARSTAEAGSLRAGALALLDSADTDVSELADAIQLLGWVATDDDIPLLESLAIQADPVLSTGAREAIGRVGSTPAVAVLTNRLDSGRASERPGLLHALGLTRSPDALPVLELWLQRPETRLSAARALAVHGDARAARAVGRAFVEARSELEPLARALAAFGESHEEARGVLHRSLRARGTPHRGAALLALARVGDPVVQEQLRRELRQGPTPARVLAARGLAALGDPADVPALEDAAMTGPRELRTAATSSLGSMGAAGQRALCRLVWGAPVDVAGAAVWSLSDPTSEEAVEALLRAATVRPRTVRETARSRLFEAPWVEPPGEVLELARLVLATDGLGAAPAIGLLIEHGDPDDRFAVEEALFHGTTQARLSAVDALRRIPAPWAGEILLGMADDDDPRVSEVSISALARRPGVEGRLESVLLAQLERGRGGFGIVEQTLLELDSAAGLRAVLSLAREGTQPEASRAIQALANSGSAEHVAALEALMPVMQSDPQRELGIYRALLWSGTASEAVMRGLRDAEEPALRALGVQAMARDQSPDATHELFALVDDPVPEVRSAAIAALGDLGGEPALDAITTAARDPETVWPAVQALQAVGTPAARDALMDLALGEHPPDVRAAALQAGAWGASGSHHDAMVASLSAADPEVSQAAVRALQSTGTTAAAQALATVLEAEPPLARAAAHALRALGGDVARRNADSLSSVLEEEAGLVDDYDLW